MNFQKLMVGMSHQSTDVVSPDRVLCALTAAGADTLLRLYKGEIPSIPIPTQTLNKLFIPLFVTKLLKDLPGEEYHYEYTIKPDYPLYLGDIVVTRITVDKLAPQESTAYLSIYAVANNNIVGTGQVIAKFIPLVP